MNTAWTQIGGFGIVVAALAWLIKSLLTNWFTKDVAMFEARLRARYDIEMERLNAQLQIEQARDHVRYSKLHEMQARVVATLYAQINTVVEHLRSCAAFTRSDLDLSEHAHDSINKAMDSFVEARLSYKKHEIYFDESLCAQLEDFFELLNTALEHRSIWRVTGEWKKEHGSNFLMAWENVQLQLPDTLQALKAQFRKVLGAACPQNEKHASIS